MLCSNSKVKSNCVWTCGPNTLSAAPVEEFKVKERGSMAANDSFPQFSSNCEANFETVLVQPLLMLFFASKVRILEVVRRERRKEILKAVTDQGYLAAFASGQLSTQLTLSP